MAERTFRGRSFQAMTFKGGGWFRLFGKGVAWKDTRRHPPLFSERNGYARCLALGPWLLTWLR